jgi:hypothetical protein
VKKTVKKNIIILILTFVIIVCLVGSFIVYAKSEEEKPILQTKVTEELNYLENYLVSILGDFNSLSIQENTIQLKSDKTAGEEQQTETKQSANTKQEGTVSPSEETQNSSNKNANSSQGNSEDNTENQNEQPSSANSILAKDGKYSTNWSKIELQIEHLYQTWNTVAIDLHALNIEGNSILSFSNFLNSATQNIKKKQKTAAMDDVTKLYDLLLDYKKQYDQNSEKTKLMVIQNYVIQAYTNVTNAKWQEANKQLTQAEKDFANLLNTVIPGQEQNQVIKNQCYILLNELKSAVNLQDKDIFYIQFQNLDS